MFEVARRVIVALLVALVALGATATAAAPVDLTGLWYDAADPGWGVGIFQQGDKLFLTLFTYDPANRPVWYVASDVTRQAGTNFDPCGSQAFSGRLYAVAGPALGGTPGTAQARDVGRVIGVDYLVPACRDEIGISFEIDGRTTAKRLTRQTWAAAPLAGSFEGVMVRAAGSCPGLVPRTIHGPLSVTTAAGELTIDVNDRGAPPFTNSCRLRGAYRQAGRGFAMTGSETCFAGDQGLVRPFALFDLVVNENGLTAEVQYTDGQCPTTARLSGARAY